MPYLTDPDLDFLKSCKNEDLAVLVNLLTHTRNGRKRYLSRLARLPRFQYFFPDHKKYWNLIAAEIQIYGGHTFANVITGSGVPYKDILKTVCKKMKVKGLENKNTETLEVLLLSKIMLGSLEKSTISEREALMAKSSTELAEYAQKAMRKELGISHHIGSFNKKWITALFAGSVAKAVFGRTLSYGILKLLKLGVTNWLGKAFFLFSGPMGWAITLTWLVTDFFKADYRILVPVVVQVAFMRAMQKDQRNLRNAA